MSHTLYRSPAIVIAHSPRGEADRVVTLFTCDHGLVRTRVQSVRTAGSRLRYGVQFLAMGEYEYVRGKHTWRLTGAHGVSYPDAGLIGEGIAHVCSDIVRLMQPEEPNTAIYQELVSLAHNASTKYEIAQARGRILSELGYVDLSALPAECDQSTYPTFIRIFEQGLAAAHL